MSLLIIEDEAPFVELLLHALKPKAFRVARTIQDAFKLIDEDLPEVILLDLKLPGSPTEETVGRIRELKTRSKDATIIVLTGYPDLQRLQELAVREGAKTVLSKDVGGIFGTLSEEVLSSMRSKPSSNPIVAKIEDAVIKIVGPEPPPRQSIE